MAPYKVSIANFGDAKSTEDHVFKTPGLVHLFEVGIRFSRFELYSLPSVALCFRANGYEDP